MQVRLTRLEKSDFCVRGVLAINGRLHCCTLEDPDHNNAVGVSCIPPGRYACRQVESPRFGATYEVADVPNRTHILFHAGNTSADTRGCILLGQTFTMFGDTPAIGSSRAAVTAFLARMAGAASFELEIMEVR